MNKKLFLIIAFIIIFISKGFTQNNRFIGIGYLKVFEEAYPDITFSRRYDLTFDDWVITVTVPNSPGEKNEEGRSKEFFWANGSFLPEEEIQNKNNYWTLLYTYKKILEDPENYTNEQKEAIRNYGSTESRKNGAGTPMFLFDFIYESDSRIKLERHIKRISFLGVKTNIHERIVDTLKMVEEEILELSTKDEEVAGFLKNLKSADAYYWREIEGTKRKSFHSLGIAIDVLPKNLAGKQIFWSWAKDKFPKDWMLVPLKNRWMPPQRVIDIFEKYGFIWGGKWVIYDNMHFEYHPELIKFNFEER